MAKIKPLNQIKEKWARVTPQRTQDYEAGVRSPSADWAQETSAAQDRYNQGVQEAVARNAFQKGVQNAGTQKWQQGAISKGVARFGQGVAAAEQAYADGFAPYADTIASTDLPPRYPAGDDRNIQRTIALNKALRARKLQGR